MKCCRVNGILDINKLERKALQLQEENKQLHESLKEQHQMYINLQNRFNANLNESLRMCRVCSKGK